MDGTDTISQENESGAAKIQERLQRRHQARVEDAERRKEAKQSQSVAEEKGEYFSSTFNKERECIELLLSSCSVMDRTAAAQTLDEATGKMVQLQKFLNDSTGFLTQYELRQAQAALQKLQTALAEKREEALPKKKFAFRARSKATEKASKPVSDTPSPAEGDTPGGDACGFSNKENECLTKTAEEIQKQDVLLTHLTNCKVRLFGSPSTVHLKHITNCEILCGPVSGSVFVDHCKDSTLALLCQQLRTHNTTNTQVYLHIIGRPIIEDCQGVSFAPLSWSYPTLDDDLSVSGLDRNRNNWNQVDDFNWLAAGTPSPNWTLIPEADRKSNWDP
ncbi:tubulin-specific chaperone C [Genypterus blacodes]|uniref:tubulin-specific chaperone C n=1 Tax=Genypterus blacodes TaxID=154954 RepID=UPI003F7578F2